MQSTQITQSIIAACLNTQKLLGAAHSEKIYKDALLYELQKQGFQGKEWRIAVGLQQETFYHYLLDIVVEDKVLIKIAVWPGKTPSKLLTECERAKNLTGLKNAVLVNFGSPELEINII